MMKTLISNPKVESELIRIDVSLIKYLKEIQAIERDRGNDTSIRSASKMLALRLDAAGGLVNE